MAMTPRDITTPEQLVACWEANAISPWNAIAVMLHRVDDSTVEEWILALPLDLQEQVVDDVTRWGPPDAEKVTLGRGAGLEEKPRARAALREWLRVGPRPESWLSPEIVARVRMNGGQAPPERFIARAFSSSEEGSRVWNLAFQLLAPRSDIAFVGVLRGGASAEELQRGARLDLHLAGEPVGAAEILQKAGAVQEGDLLSALDAPPRLRRAA